MNNGPLINPSPKQKFQQTPANIHAHRELMQNDDFERGVEAALLEYQSLLSRTDPFNFNQCAAAHLRIQGAQEFLHQLRHLAEQPKVMPSVMPQNLDHTA